MAKRKTDLSAAKSLTAKIGRIDMNPSEALIAGMQVQGTHEAPNTHDTYDTHDTQSSSRHDGKRKRINMAFTDENIADMRLAASAYGVSQTEFTNRVLREWFDSHAEELEAFKSARAALGK